MTLPNAAKWNTLPSDSVMQNSDGHAEVSVVRNSSADAPPTAPNSPVGATKSNPGVSSLVAKSKKAAASLFTLLHAKNCKQGVHRCSHPGCPEAKLIFLHLKTCKATNTGPCPTNHKGCADARKLLAHYRKCREIRSRQVANNRSRSQQHVCLVCSLVARNAKGTFDRNRSTSPKGHTSRHLIPALRLSSDSTAQQDSRSRNRPRSTSPFRGSHGVSSSVACTTASEPRMLPPPPRFAFSSESASGRSTYFVRSTQSDTLHTVATGLAPPPGKLSKSLDDAGGFFRQRAESFDVRRISGLQERNTGQPVYQSEEKVELESERKEELSPRHGRRRSASCSVPSTSKASSGIFDPIEEEPVGEQLQLVLEGDS